MPSKIQEELIATNGVIKKTEIHKFLVSEIHNAISKAGMNQNSYSDDVLKEVKSKVESVKEFYKEDVPILELTHIEAWEYLKSITRVLIALMDPKNNDWDFKKVVSKVEKLRNELIKETDKIDVEKEQKKKFFEKDKAEVSTAISTITRAGMHMNITKEIMVVSLKTFSNDVEKLMTDTVKVGSILYGSKQ